MPLQSLLNHLKTTASLSQVSGLVSWDQETMMPPKGAAQRAEQSAALAAILHARNCDPRIPDWISKIDKKSLADFDRRNVEEAERFYTQATKIPETLAGEMAKAASEGQIIWARARDAGDFSVFAPALEKLVRLKREEAACLSTKGCDPYDALLDQFEPGAKIAELGPMLDSLRAPLVALREKIAGKPQPKALAGDFAGEGQLQLAKKIAGQLGYDFEAGRIDISTHPFSSGTGNDSRITTRIDEKDPFNCIYSTIHEVGHALYSQGTCDPFLPAADYCSMAVHESQSRFWENQIARSRNFANWLYPEMQCTFGEFSVGNADEFYAIVNRVETGFIRTEADEIHYNLHVLLRFELEQELIAGTLEVQDLEDAWNTRFERDFGLQVTDTRLGVLQDVHWSVGLFGYFPTYTLGNIYAACLNQAIRSAIPDMDDMVKKAEMKPILNWLRKNIHEKGRLLPAPELIAQATGSPPSTTPLIDYLATKFGELYDL